MQATRLELALANGTLANFSADASDPTIWHSVQVRLLNSVHFLP